MEAELKTMEKNIPKIKTILSSMENSDIALMEHLQNRQVKQYNCNSTFIHLMQIRARYIQKRTYKHLKSIIVKIKNTLY